jgi:hypothetical protein
MARVRALLVPVLSSVSLALLVMTVAGPDWIERFTGAAPDGGSGAVEVLVAVVSGVLAIVTGLGAVAAARRGVGAPRGRPPV